MKRTSKNNFLFWLATPVVVCLLMFSNSASAQKKAPDKLLANKTYTVELVEQGGKKAAEPEPDEINFKTDKFTSKMMKTEEQFAPSTYTASLDSANLESKVITFETEGKNPGGEILKWTGTITGEDVEGTAVWTNKKGKVKREYNFTGTLKGKKKK